VGDEKLDELDELERLLNESDFCDADGRLRGRLRVRFLLCLAPMIFF